MVGGFSRASVQSELLLWLCTGNASYSYRWFAPNPAERTGPNSQHAPDQVDLVDMEHDNELFPHDAPNGHNHCVFVRGIRISLQQSLWSSIMGRPLRTKVSPIQGFNPSENPV